MSDRVRIVVLLGKEESEESMPRGSTVEDLLRHRKLHPDAYIVTRDSRPVPLTHVLEDGERLKLIRVASGG